MRTYLGFVILYNGKGSNRRRGTRHSLFDFSDCVEESLSRLLRACWYSSGTEKPLPFEMPTVKMPGQGWLGDRVVERYSDVAGISVNRVYHTWAHSESKSYPICGHLRNWNSGLSYPTSGEPFCIHESLSNKIKKLTIRIIYVIMEQLNYPKSNQDEIENGSRYPSYHTICSKWCLT
jgi:hypothetical protein